MSLSLRVGDFKTCHKRIQHVYTVIHVVSGSWWGKMLQKPSATCGQRGEADPSSGRRRTAGEADPKDGAFEANISGDGMGQCGMQSVTAALIHLDPFGCFSGFLSFPFIFHSSSLQFAQSARRGWPSSSGAWSKRAWPPTGARRRTTRSDGGSNGVRSIVVARQVERVHVHSFSDGVVLFVELELSCL